MKRFTVLLLVLGVASLSQAEMLADFETGLNGFVAGANTTISQSTTAGTVTSGTYSLKIQQSAVSYWGVTWQAPTVPAKLGLLQFDLSMIDAEWPNENWTRFVEKIALQSNGPGGGWFEIGTTAANWTWKDPSNTTLCPNDWQATYYDDVTKTCTIDISGYNLTGATYFNIVFSTGITGSAPFGAFYIDNMHFVDKPNTPSPADGGVGVIGADTTLSWENATSSLDGIHVWFGVAPEPNLADPNTILSLDTYKILLTNIYSEATPGLTSSCPMPTLTDGVEYTWCIESDPNTFPVPFWTFTATTNNPPVANAGADDLYIYEYADLNNITITLTGSATDDGQISPLIYAWTQTAGPAATINSPTAAVTTVTLAGGLASTTEEDGGAVPYEFQLVADDGQFTGSDAVTVHVNSDSCRASIENGSFYFYGDIAGPAGAGDENRDCKIDLYDFAELAINWLGCTDTFEGCN